MTKEAEKTLKKLERLDPELAKLARDVARLLGEKPEIRKKLRKIKEKILEEAAKDERLDDSTPV